MTLYTEAEQQAVETFLTLSADDIPDQVPVAHAVATLALSRVQERLPQCGVVNDQGRLTLTRQAFPRWRADIVVLPQFLFMINWADSAPGISWPESYFATYLPVFDRFIVTASQDCPDMRGVTDLAIGSFAADRDLVTGAREVISAWWAMQRDHDQDRFAYVWSEGRVALEQANHWADTVWETSEDEDMDEEDV